MRKWHWVGIVLLILLLGIGAILGLGWVESQRNEQVHFNREETLLLVSNPSRSAIRLFMSGRTLQEAKPLEPFNGKSIWLPKGNYFLLARQNGREFYYPIPIIGHRSGPDTDGTFSITVRSFKVEDTPPLIAGSGAWAYIPSGHFLFGERLNPHEPHYIWLPAFFINTFEVTNAQYREFLQDPLGYNHDMGWTEEGRRWRSSNVSQATALLTPGHAEYERFGRDDLPVVYVNWYEAMAFCKWLTGKLGKNRWQFSLASEGEWEKASRGPDSFDYGLGMSISDNEVPLYNWRKNPDAAVTVVGLRESLGHYLANRYGLLHMSGNAAEWTLSVHRHFNQEHPYVDDDRNWEKTQGSRVVRGGSWYTASTAVLSLGYLEALEPEVNTPYLGFRIVAHVLP